MDENYVSSLIGISKKPFDSNIFNFKVTTFSQAVSAKVEQAKDATGNIRIPGMLRKDKCYTLLVIDDPNTDW